MRIFDSVMLNDELDMLECRLVEIGDVVDAMIVVEADVDHQDHPKPYHLTENLDRFDPWKDKLVVVRASGLPTAAENPDPWSREHGQREWVAEGLRLAGATGEDVILHGDCDEIPRGLVVRNVRPQGFVSFTMACYSMAVDWQHPDPWQGTVAAFGRNVRTFSGMRDSRNFAPQLPNAGWHLGWLGGPEAQLRKLNAFCHPEIAARTLNGIEQNFWLEQGWHVDGKKLIPVDVDHTWPKWIAERRCPESWFRDRSVEPSRWTPPTGRA